MKQKEAKKFIEKLCHIWKVPKIPVYVKPNINEGKYFGVFIPDNYSIEIQKKCNYEELLHEFLHYIITLMQNLSDLEEELTDRAITGMKEKIRFYHPELYNIMKGKRK